MADAVIEAGDTVGLGHAVYSSMAYHGRGRLRERASPPMDTAAVHPIILCSIRRWSFRAWDIVVHPPARVRDNTHGVG